MSETRPMDKHEKKLHHFIQENQARCELLLFEESCHSVSEAANTAGGDPDQFIKNICLVSKDGEVIVAIVKGEDRVNPRLVADALEISRPKIAGPEEMLEKTGYPCGGTPSFGFKATFLIDPRVMEKDVVYTGGGSERALVKVGTGELLRLNGGRVEMVRK